MVEHTALVRRNFPASQRVGLERGSQVKPDFWHERWERGEIGFHQQDFNRYMQEFVGRLGVQPGAEVLVPLCGKSLDMVWLVKQGYRVTGIEISEVAVKNFFVENNLAYTVECNQGYISYCNENTCLICADFFTVEKANLPHIDAVYDRASLIAMPPEMRPDYAQHFSRLIDTGVRSLLVTLEYPQEEMKGPPFSVNQDEVKRLFGARYCIESLHSEDCLAREPRFRKKGLTRLEERVYLLKKTRAC